MWTAEPDEDLIGGRPSMTRDVTWVIRSTEVLEESDKEREK